MYNCRRENVTPWDKGELQPPLRDLLLTDEANWPREGRALVPGCGRVCSLPICFSILVGGINILLSQGIWRDLHREDSWIGHPWIGYLSNGLASCERVSKSLHMVSLFFQIQTGFFNPHLTLINTRFRSATQISLNWLCLRRNYLTSSMTTRQWFVTSAASWSLILFSKILCGDPACNAVWLGTTDESLD